MIRYIVTSKKNGKVETVLSTLDKDYAERTYFEKWGQTLLEREDVDSYNNAHDFDHEADAISFMREVAAEFVADDPEGEEDTLYFLNEETIEFEVPDGHEFGNLNVRYHVWNLRQKALTNNEREVAHAINQLLLSIQTAYATLSNDELYNAAVDAEVRAGRIKTE